MRHELIREINQHVSGSASREQAQSAVTEVVCAALYGAIRLGMSARQIADEAVLMASNVDRKGD